MAKNHKRTKPAQQTLVNGQSLYGAIDLHSDNGYYGIIDEQGRRMLDKRLPNNLEIILKELAPFKEGLKGIVVESTYNWYWLIDGLVEEGYPVLLINPGKIKQYDGLKYSDDKTDAFHLAHLLQLGLVKGAYIYPKQERAYRDLLRRRRMLVNQRTMHLLSLKSFVQREDPSCLDQIKAYRMDSKKIGKDFDHEAVALMGQINVEMINQLSQSIAQVEKMVVQEVKLKPDFERLKAIPGIGMILALTVMLETGTIHRFKTDGDYCSYCRTVDATRYSNEKKKGDNNKRNGNRYLSWAMVEAAHFSIRYDKTIARWYQRKMARSHKVVAIKAVASKLARSIYHVLKTQQDFDVEKSFGMN